MHIDEGDSLKQGLTDTLGRIQETIFINESGLYSLILSSKLPTAKKFKHWITSEVLPQIRQTGTYSNANSINNALDLLEPAINEAGLTVQQKYNIVKDILKKSGIIIPDITARQPEKVSVNEYDEAMRIAERFLNEVCIMDKHHMVKVSDLYNKFLNWCKENKIQTLTKTMLSRRLYQLGVGKYRGHAYRFWTGIKILEEG